jgi:formylglycine-generating enzyme required for sulfatase activity
MPRTRRVAVALAVLLPLAAGLPWLMAQAPAAQKVALLVGVRSYDHANLTDLEYPENDVTELAAVLKGAGYRVVLLTTGAADARLRPTRANVRRELAAVLRGRTKRDTVVVGLAGHGVQAGEAKDSYFCPSDAKPTETGTMVSLSELYRELDDSGVGVKLLLVDACRNDPQEGRGIDGDTAPRPPRGVGALFSCSAGERAFETGKLGKGHGVFFHFVLEGLKGGAVNEDGEVTWDRLREYVKRRVSREVPVVIGGGAKQHPNEMGNLSGESPVLLVRAASPKGRDDAAAVAPKGAKEITNAIGMELVLIPAGTFQMGSPTDEKDRQENEGPRHEVRISKSFYLGKYAVTQAEYEKVMGTNPSYFSASGNGKDSVAGLDTSRFPVENVSWEDAQEFCRKLSARDGRKYRLPTEAEWEYSCRAGTTTPFHFGNALNGDRANCDGNSPYGTEAKGKILGRTCRVGSYRPNAFGLYDMHGNVWQWCQDWYGEKYYNESTNVDPEGPSTGGARVQRGGPWDFSARYCRAASRFWDPPSDRMGGFGFRVASRLD